MGSEQCKKWKKRYYGSFDNLEDAKNVLLQNSIPLISNEHGDKYQVNKDYFKRIDSQEKAFWLGFICADGSMKKRRSKDTYYLRINQKEKHLLEEFKKDIEFTGKVKHITKKQKGRYSEKPFHEIEIHSKKFSDYILKCGKTTYKKDQQSIPHGVPKEYIADYIRGYVEGDGSIYYGTNNKSWNIGISGEKMLLQEIQCFLGGVGGIYPDKTIWRLRTTGNLQVEKIMDILYYRKDLHGIKHLKYRSENNE